MRARSARDRESGQATIEFALIFIPLMMVVGGIIYFGIGLNYWLDMNRVANQGARWAAVNNWPPQCPRGETICTNCNSATACSDRPRTTRRQTRQSSRTCSAAQTRNTSRP